MTRASGGKSSRTVSVRVIAATNKNLEEAVRQHTFREDLYYRLNVFTLVLPPVAPAGCRTLSFWPSIFC